MRRSTPTAIFASLALLILGTNMLGTLLSVRLTLEGMPMLTVGVVLVFHSIGFVVGVRYVTQVIRRVGQIRAFAAFAAITCATVLIHPIYVSEWLWAPLRAVVGFCSAGLLVILESWISGRATSQTRGTLLGIYLVVYYLAAAGGQLLFGAGQPTDYWLYSLVAILIVLSLVPLSLTREQAPMLGAIERLKLAEINHLSPSALFGATVSGIAASAFFAMGPVFATRIGLSIGEVSAYMMIAVLSAMAMQIPLGRLSDTRDRRSTLMHLAAFAALAAIMAGALGARWGFILYPATGVMFGIVTSLYSISLAMLNDYMKEGEPVAASAGLLFAYGIGSVVGPLAGALSMQIIGPEGLLLFIGAALVGLAGLVRYRAVRIPSIPIEQQGRFVGVVAEQSAPEILVLDPRTDESLVDDAQPDHADTGVQ